MAPNNEIILNAFLEQVARAENLLGKIRDLHDNHYNTHPDTVETWDVGCLLHLNQTLKYVLERHGIAERDDAETLG